MTEHGTDHDGQFWFDQHEAALRILYSADEQLDQFHDDVTLLMFIIRQTGSLLTTAVSSDIQSRYQEVANRHQQYELQRKLREEYEAFQGLYSV